MVTVRTVLVVLGRQQRLAVRVERQPHARGIELLHQFQLLGIPEHQFLVAAGGEPLAVRTERRGASRIGKPFEGSDLFAALGIDHTDRLRLVFAEGGPLAVGAEAELPGVTAWERVRDLASGKIPRPQPLVAGADEPLAVRAVGETPGPAGVARDGRGHLAGTQIPDPDGTGFRLVLPRPDPVPPGEGLAVGAEGDGVHPAGAGQGADQFAGPGIEHGNHVGVGNCQELALAVLRHPGVHPHLGQAEPGNAQHGDHSRGKVLLLERVGSRGTLGQLGRVGQLPRRGRFVR